jgi:hypothetical protein
VEKARRTSRGDDVSTDELEDVIEDGRHRPRVGRLSYVVALLLVRRRRMFITVVYTRALDSKSEGPTRSTTPPPRQTSPS